MSLIAELKRRNVIRMAGLYLVAAWLLVQVAGTVLPWFNVSESVLRGVVIVLAIGFVPALVFALVFEITPEGIKRDEEVPLEKSIAPQTAQRMDQLIIVILLLALAYFGFDKFLLAPKREEARDAATAMASAAAASATRAVESAPGASKSIAVLPFENLSADKDNDYFASGMQDMILTKLAGISELKVISRTSTEKYKSHPDNLREIARQLGVTSILEGSVQKSGNQVLINVQLIDAISDQHLWAESYPRTLDNIFGVEGEVAQKIADALQAKLTTAELAVVVAAPTRNAAAYDTFLKAEYLLQEAELTWVDATYLKAEAGYRKAIALDPGFALAHAKLAYSQLSRNWNATPLGAADLAAVRPLVDRALALDPNLPEAHLALGYYHYWAFRHYDQANVEFERTLQLAPSNAEALIGLSYVARRQGRLAESQSYMQRALAISPRDANALSNYGVTFVLLREYAQGDKVLQTALALSPIGANAAEMLLTSRLFGFGDVSGARALYATPPEWGIPSHNTLAGDIFNLINARAYAEYYDRKFDAALRIWESAPITTLEERRTGEVARALIALLGGRGAAVRPQCERLAPALRAELSAKPDSLSLLQQLSWIDVCLGRNARAIAGAKRAAQLMSVSRDRFFGSFQLVGLAQVAAWAGDPDLALQAIGQLLAMPAGQTMSIERLRGDPVWDPLRRDPRFIALLREPVEPAEAAP